MIYNHLEKLCARYNLDKEEIKNNLEAEDENQVILDTLEKIGKARGAYISGGRIDSKKTANILLTDFREGKIRKNYT